MYIRTCIHNEIIVREKETCLMHSGIELLSQGIGLITNPFYKLPTDFDDG